MAKLLSTGKMGEICGVGHRTVLRWIEEGRIKTFRLPGIRQDHRIPPEEAVRFLREHNIPVPYELRAYDVFTIIVLEDNEKIADDLENDPRLDNCCIVQVKSPLDAGRKAGETSASVVIIGDCDSPEKIEGMLKASGSLQNTEIINAAGQDKIVDKVIQKLDER